MRRQAMIESGAHQHQVDVGAFAVCPPGAGTIEDGLPAAIAREAHLRAHQRVRISVVGRQIIITPLEHEALTLEERLERFDPARRGGEAMQEASRLGAENW